MLDATPDSRRPSRARVRPPEAGPAAGATGRGQPAGRLAPGSFWQVRKADLARAPQQALQGLLERVRDTSPLGLFDVVEQGVPVSVVPLLAAALGRPAGWVMDLLGVSETTFRRKEEGQEPLPEVVGHRAMGLLRLMACLQRLLDESGDAAAVAGFDLGAWVAVWVAAPLPELGGKSPAQMLRNPEGQRIVEALLERMRGGLPA